MPTDWKLGLASCSKCFEQAVFYDEDVFFLYSNEAAAAQHNTQLACMQLAWLCIFVYSRRLLWYVVM